MIAKKERSRMRSKLSKMLTVLLVTAIVLGVGPTIRASPPPPPAFWVMPETETFTTTNASVGTQFNVTVWVATTVPQSTAWQVKLGFNASQLEAVATGYTGVGKSMWFTGHNSVPVSAIIDNATGYVFTGESLFGVDFVGPSNGSLFYVTFQIIAAPTPGNTLTSLIDTATYAPGDTFVLDENSFAETPFATGHCTYTFSAGGPPPPTRHDVAVSSVTPSSDHVTQGNLLSIGVVALNNGTVTETFDVNATYDGTLIGTQTVASLAAGNTQLLTFSWNTTGVTAGNYTITATAVPVAGETDLSNNAKTSAQVQVLVPGPGHSPYNLNGDGIVDIKDINMAARAFGSYGPNYLYPGSPPSPRWEPKADVGGFNTVNIMDIALIAQHFGQHD